MTIQEVLDRIDAIKPNMVPQDIKVAWLSELDAMIDREIIRRHFSDNEKPYRHGHWSIDPLTLAKHWVFTEDEAGEETEAFAGYDPNDDLTETTLLAPFPYDKLYQSYLAMQIDIANAEVEKYNNDSALFSAAYKDYSDWYTRNHYPIPEVPEFSL